MRKSKFTTLFLLASAALLTEGQGGSQDSDAAASQPNILLMTLDDMGFGTTGAEGCTVPGITPNIDQLAAEGMLFTQGFIMTPICGPSRGAILSGRYPHNSGMMGHGKQPPANWTPPKQETPTISRYLREKGYHATAILKHKRNAPFNTWDISYDEAPYGVGHEDRSPAVFKERTSDAIRQAQKAGKPFFIYANPIDPHKPWSRTEWEKEALRTWNPDKPYPDPGRRYHPDEIEVPTNLPDLPGVREKLVPYYESLHRGDECIGAILEALDESGLKDNTIVVFLSDNGMGTIGAKAMLYHHGLRTPMILRWPGKVAAGKVDKHSVISSVDIFPTILEAIGQPEIEALEGRSFLPLALGKRERGERTHAYAAHNYYGDSTPEWYFPQRAIIDGDFCYIWNAYVKQPNGDRPFLPDGWKDVLDGYLTDEHPEVVAKVDSIVNKVPEELFDLRTDPGCWKNLVNDPKHAEVLNRYRAILENEMTSSNDPQLKFWPH